MARVQDDWRAWIASQMSSCQCSCYQWLVSDCVTCMSVSCAHRAELFFLIVCVTDLCLCDDANAYAHGGSPSLTCQASQMWRGMLFWLAAVAPCCTCVLMLAKQSQGELSSCVLVRSITVSSCVCRREQSEAASSSGTCPEAHSLSDAGRWCEHLAPPQRLGRFSQPAIVWASGINTVTASA